MHATIMGMGPLAVAQRQGAEPRHIGSGPDGVTLLVSDASGQELEQRIVAAQAVDRARERCRRLALLHHPVVRRVLDVREANQGLVISLEPAPERSWLDQLQQGPVPVAVAKRMVAALAEALGLAHRLGVAHGRLHPAQLGWTSQQPRLELCGVATWPEPDDEWARALARPAMEPEDSRDVFALGVLLASLVAGKLIQPGEPLPSGLGDCQATVQLMLGEDPDRRPSAAALVAVLRAATAQQAATLVGDLSDTMSPPADTRLGQTLGRFRLDAVVGEGGMGAVFRATDLSNQHTVAVKVLKDHAARDPELRRRFRREARLLAEVRSPYVANLIEAHADGDLLFMALEFVQGRDLDAVLEDAAREDQRGGLAERQALQIAGDVCRALVEPHRRGIVHRDIKPANVLLVADPQGGQAVKLLDFGIARAEENLAGTAVTRAGSVLGTPQYMSPEQCTGGRVGPTADVYALGATLFDLLSGRPPFDGDDLGKILAAHVTMAPPVLSELVDVSSASSDIVARALSKDPHDRYQDAAEMLDAIERALRGEPTAIVQHPQLPEAKRFFEHEFQWDLVSSPSALWPHVSNTERMNQAVGLPAVSVDRVVEDDGSVRTLLENRVLGQLLRWEEFPFEWVEGKRWGLVRVFQKGIMRWYTVELELAPRPEGGTRLTYRMRFEPFGWLGRLIVFVEMVLKQKRALGDMFRRIDAHCARGQLGTDPFVTVARMSAANREHLGQRLQAVRSRGVSEPVLEALESFLRVAPDQEVARLRPLQFARQRGLDERAVIDACLHAVQADLLVMLWDVICPLCRIPSDFLTSLENIEAHGSCPACRLDFPIDLAESVELVLRAHPEIRDAEVRSYCIGGPAHSPHVAAQVRLAPGERLALGLELEVGTLQLRATELPGTVEVEVSPSEQRNSVDLKVDAQFARQPTGREVDVDPRLALSRAIPRVLLAPGRQRITLTNALDREVVLRLERVASKRDALTVARVVALPLFRQLFPGQCLERGRLLSMSRAFFVAVRGRTAHVGETASPAQRTEAAVRPDELSETERLEATVRLIDAVVAVVESEGGAIARIDESAAIAAFQSAAPAVAAALQLIRTEGTRVSVAAHAGSVMATTVNGRLEYLGDTVAIARRVASVAGPGEAVLTRSLLDHDGTQQALRSSRGTPGAPSIEPIALDQEGLWGLKAWIPRSTLQ